MRKLYSLFLCLMLPIALGRLLVKSIWLHGYRRRWYERLGQYPDISAQRPVWIHAVSVGEVMAAVPLVRQLRETDPQLPVLLTTTTPTGSDRVTATFGHEVLHFYAPYDLLHVVRKFIRNVNPRIGIIMETELWPNLLHEAKRHQIPLVLANGRISDRSYKGYQRFPELVKSTLRQFDYIAAQSELDRQRFIDLGAGAKKTVISGSVKFDIELSASVMESGEQLRRTLGSNRPVFLAASTHKGEEIQLLKAFQKIRQTHTDALLILVPRHPERFPRVAELISRHGMTYIRRSSHEECLPETQVYLGDTMGELAILYAAADVAYIGGSLVPVGGHNMLESLVWGVPVVMGHYLHNFRDISQRVIEAGAGEMVNNSQQLAQTVSRLLSDPVERENMGARGRALIDENRGALRHLTEKVFSLMPIE